MLRENLSRDLIRPVIHRLFAGLIYGSAFSLGCAYVFSDSSRDLRPYGFALCAALSALGAWSAFLRLDGMHLPRLKHLRLPRRKQRTVSPGDMNDHIDDSAEEFDALSEGERDSVSLIGNLLLCIAFALISALI